MLVFIFSVLVYRCKNQITLWPKFYMLGKLSVKAMNCDCVTKTECDFLTMAFVGLLLTLDKTEKKSLFWGESLNYWKSSLHNL